MAKTNRWFRGGYSSNQKREAIVNEREKQGLRKILAELDVPELKDFVLTEDSDGYSVWIEVTRANIKDTGSIAFRYRFSLSGSECLGIQYTGPIKPDYNRVTRSYGYDFDSDCMKPAAIKKLIKAIVDSFEEAIKQEELHKWNLDARSVNRKALEEALASVGHEVDLSLQVTTMINKVRFQPTEKGCKVTFPELTLPPERVPEVLAVIKSLFGDEE